jgi:hypothetical protein
MPIACRSRSPSGASASSSAASTPGNSRGRVQRPLGDLVQVEGGGQLARVPRRRGLDQLLHPLLQRHGRLADGLLHPPVGVPAGAAQRDHRSGSQQ